MDSESNAAETTHIDNKGRKYAIGEVSKFDLVGPGAVNIQRGSAGTLTLIASPDDNERLEVKTGSDSLSVQFKGGILRNREPHDRMNYEITVPVVSELRLNGGLACTAVGIDTRNLEVELRDGSSVNFTDLRATVLEINIAAIGSAILSGAVASLKAEMDGKSTLDASKLACEEAEIEISNESNASLVVSRRVRVRADAKSVVTVAGDKIELDVKTTGASTFRQTN